MQNTEYEKEYYFNIDQYLIKNYQMNLPTRRAVCSRALRSLNDELMEELIDEVIADYAIDKLNLRKPDEPDSETKDDQNISNDVPS